jgi:two-component system sensor histidine kinase YesM
VKKVFNRSISIGMNIFLMTLSIVSVVLLLTSFLFLVVFSGIIDDSVETQAREINKQIVMNFEGYINSVIETATYIQFASINLDAGRDSAALDELYQVNKEIKKDVVSIFLFDKEGRRVAGPALDFSFGGNVSGLPWFKSALDLKEIYNFSATQEKSVAQDRAELVISVSKAIDFVRNGKNETGILLIELNNATLTDLAGKTNLGNHGHLLILNDRGSLLYSSEPPPEEMTAYSAPLASRIFLGSRKVTIKNIDMFINVNTLMNTRWLIVTVSNINEIRNAMNHLSLLLAVIFLATIALSALVSGLISLRVSRPINQLKSAMLKIENGDFSVPVSVSGQREIVTLAHSFNSMVTNIQDLMGRLVSQQREKRKLELQVLQNQINPHFLYNTLDSIVWLAEHNRNPEVITTVVSLARFFRISISKGEIFIPVEDEISHVENYLTIQSIRYSNKFTYFIKVDDDIRKMKVMKLILQPLVENAIHHGIGDETGYIEITGIIRDGFLVFGVTNTGYGITDAKIGEMYETMRGGQEHPSVGIRNVYQRLKLYYGETATITITSIPDESTTVSLLIPAQIQEDQHE